MHEILSYNNLQVRIILLEDAQTGNTTWTILLHKILIRVRTQCSPQIGERLNTQFLWPKLVLFGSKLTDFLKFLYYQLCFLSYISNNCLLSYLLTFLSLYAISCLLRINLDTALLRWIYYMFKLYTYLVFSCLVADMILSLSKYGCLPNPNFGCEFGNIIVKNYCLTLITLLCCRVILVWYYEPVDIHIWQYLAWS